jgi:hypothetical protein
MKICLEYRTMFSETQHLSPAANEQKLVRLYMYIYMYNSPVESKTTSSVQVLLFALFLTSAYLVLYSITSAGGRI